MIRLFLAALFPSLLAIIMLPTLALSGGRPELQQRRQPPPAVDATVAIQGSKFVEASIQITAGQTVGWTNASDRDHEVIADKGEFKSGTIKPGKSWIFTFERAGTYRYHCALHPREKGVVKVEQ